MFRGIIYKYTSPSDKIYIGQTTNEKKRRCIFLNLNLRYGGTKIDNARHKYSPSNFKYEVLEIITKDSLEELKNELDKLEIYYIGYYDSYHNGYNSTIGGDKGTLGFHQNNESKVKMSESHKGIIFSEEHKLNISEALKGKHHSKETINNMIKASTCKVDVIQLDKKTGEFIKEWESFALIKRELGFDQGNIQKCCKGIHKSAYGYIWKYKN